MAGAVIDGAGKKPDTYRGGTTIRDWRPEDPQFWETIGKRVARRNLWLSVPALHLAFAVWMVWSVVVVKLPEIGFDFTKPQLFWLAGTPGLAGATLRIFYSFLVPVFGGRNFTVLTTASLLLPAIGIGFLVQWPDAPYWMFLGLALLCGFGGGNFASSMSNISFFYPKAQKGFALGINAGLGNLGVSVVQAVVPLVIAGAYLGPPAGAPQQAIKNGEVVSQLWVQNAAFIWIPVIAIVCIACWLGMNNLASATASFKQQSIIFQRKHNWIMSWIYIGTFGSFIGYSAAFPMLTKSMFPDVVALHYAWLGPLVGALIRPVGGWLSDKCGGARVTFWNFIVMAGAAVGVLQFLPSVTDGVPANDGNFWGFLGMFLLLFVTTGIGNGSTFRMVPVIFANLHERITPDRAKAQVEAAREGAAVLGFSSAMGAYGAFVIPMLFGWSMKQFGGPDTAIWIFIVFYATCIVMTWWYYSRKGAEAPC